MLFRSPHWERGVESAELVSPAIQKLAVTALGGSPPTAAEGLTALLAGAPVPPPR